MTERAEQMYWIHTRGLIVTLPAPITHEFSDPIARGEEINPTSFHRLYLIENDSILRKRYPYEADGSEYMNRVDLSWREHLLAEAKNITDTIKQAVGKITGFTDEEYAIILFGSVARGLSKDLNDTDPSNIDISVIGNFSDKNRDSIFDMIRPERIRIAERIGNNVGVFLQTPSKLAKDNYSPTIQYIGACAYPLHDAGGIWHHLEQAALNSSVSILCKKRKVPPLMVLGSKSLKYVKS